VKPKSRDTFIENFKPEVAMKTNVSHQTKVLGHISFVIALAGTAAMGFHVDDVIAAGATTYTYSPIGCLVVDQPNQGTLRIFPSGQIGNVHPTKKLEIICPLIHEAKFDETGIIRVHIIEASNQSGELLRCSAYFNHPHASEWNWSGWQDWKSGGGQTNKGQLSIPNSKHLGGSHMIRCILPPKDETLAGDEGVSRIGSYESGRDK
jgi:hypothetical protein